MTNADLPVPAARRLWLVLEPYHAVTYFAEEARAAFRDAGLRGFWRGYFAGRAAPLGPVGAGVVTACFFGFHPAMVGKAVPAVWSTAPPDQVLAARLAGADAALRTLLGDEVAGPAVTAAAPLARAAAEACEPAGRPLGAANAELAWPDEPHLVLWQAATVLREHRGDGHVAALTAAGLDPCAALVLHVAVGTMGREQLQPNRGWSDDEWAAAVDRLRDLGWVGADGTATDAGLDARAAIEDRTDALAEPPLTRIGADATARLLAALEPIDALVRAAAPIPFPNPIGVPRSA